MASWAAAPVGRQTIRWRRWVRDDGALTIGEGVFVFSVLTQLFLAHLLFGANRNDLALGLAALQCLLLLAALTQGWARSALRRQRRLALVAVPFAAVLGWTLLSVAPIGPPRTFSLFPWLSSDTWAIDPDAAQLAVVKLVGLGCAFAQGLILGASRRRTRLCVHAFLLLAAAYAAFAIALYWTSPGVLFGTVRTYHGDRLAGSFLSANSAGALLAFALALSVSLAASWTFRRRPRHAGQWGLRVAVILAQLLLGAALAMTASRAAFASAAAASLLAVALNVRTHRFKRALGLIVPLVLVAVAGLLYADVLVERLTDSHRDLGVRMSILQDHMPAIHAELWRGYGLGSFERVNAMIQTPGNFAHLWSIRALHNSYLQWIEESGLIGSLAMGLCLAVIIARLARGALARTPALWAAAVLAASLAPVLQGFVDYGLQIPSLCGQWAVFLGLGYAAAGRAIWSSKRRRRHAGASRGRRGGANVILATVLSLAGLAATATWAMQASRADAASLDASPQVRADEARRRSERSPADAGAWLNRAMARSSGRACDTACVQALDRSFDAAPLDAPLFGWRTRFALEHWADLPPPLRQRVISHIRTAWNTRSGRREVQGLTQVVASPSGRLTIVLLNEELQARPATEATPNTP